jgi:hypothetical protein
MYPIIFLSYNRSSDSAFYFVGSALASSSDSGPRLDVRSSNGFGTRFAMSGVAGGLRLTGNFMCVPARAVLPRVPSRPLH